MFVIVMFTCLHIEHEGCAKFETAPINSILKTPKLVLAPPNFKLDSGKKLVFYTLNLNLWLRQIVTPINISESLHTMTVTRINTRLS